MAMALAACWEPQRPRNVCCRCCCCCGNDANGGSARNARRPHDACGGACLARSRTAAALASKTVPPSITNCL
eukprot:11222939-Lingulodinium_polyedra.AAC.1